MKLALLCATATLAVLASISAIPFLAAVAAAFIAGALIFWRLRGEKTSAWELLAFAPFLPLLFFFVTTPGADAAMYAAQARALLTGSRDLSAAYPGVHVAMYPRGFPALIALFTPLCGIAKASLCAAIVAYACFVLALAKWLGRVTTASYALGAALVIVLVSRYVPIFAFTWGGNPNVLACALALFALLESGESAVAASVLLAGAFATHPIGALAGVACAPFLAFLPRAPGRFDWRAAIPFLAVAPLLFCFKYFGPEISPYEAAWIRRWQADQASFVHHALHIYALDYASAFSRACGDTFAITAYTCIAAAWLFRENRRAALLALFGLVYVGVLMFAGPHLPLVGAFIYADRLPPMWLVAVAPLLLLTAARFPLRAVIPVCVVLAIATHQHWSLGEPLLTKDDLAIAPCIEKHVPAGESIVASYGQGGQWLPALIDRPITQAHAHVSLFDEVSAQRKTMRSRFQFLTTHPARYGTAIPALPAAETLCESGGAKLVRLQKPANAGPDPW